MSRFDDVFDSMPTPRVTGSIATRSRGPTDSDLALARSAASDVLTKGGKYASQPWENPQTGARGSVTPLAQAYSSHQACGQDPEYDLERRHLNFQSKV